MFLRRTRTRQRIHRATAAVVAMVAAAGACGRGGADAGAPAADGGTAAGPRLVDDVGRELRLAEPARRVVSLVPSASETLLALGAGDRVVGRTRYDLAPALARVPAVGGGLDPSIEAIVALRPDVVVTWASVGPDQVAEKLAALGVRVFSVRMQDTTDVFRTVAALGRLTGRDAAAAELAARLRRELDAVRRSVAGRPRPSVLYVLSGDPPMTAGPNTFVGQLIGAAGGRMVFDDLRELWPTVAMEEVVRRRPDVVVLPVGARRAGAAAALRGRAGWRDVPAVRAGRVVEVDADVLNRPGPNMGAAARALRAVLHPDAGVP